MHLEVMAHFKEQAIFYHQDPKAYRDPRTSKVREVMMGDIVETGENEVMLSLKILAHAPLERVEIRNAVKSAAFIARSTLLILVLVSG